MTGATLFGSNGKRNVYGYNDDDEVDEADRYNHATSGGTLADDWTYSFDGIGNRLSAVGPDTGNGTNITYTYTPSNTNSYTQIKRSGVNQNPVHDKDGNMTDRGNLDFIWDGEPRRLAGAEMDFRRKPGGRDERGARASQNRLIEVQGTGSTVKYDYDYLGRRVKRQANGSTETYLYDGWNPVVTYVNGTTTRKHTYTWGADYGTGGIGALIACRKISNGKDHVYFYDGHGNVTQVMNQSGAIVAHYEYDAFGNLTKNVDQDGSGFNNENPFRFSTKFFNAETGHYYYGYRYYDPRDGRWLNRDPLGERGSQNLYAFVGNDGVNWWDYFGMKTIKVEKCQAYLFVGHGLRSNPIDWDLASKCSIGGAIVCDPGKNQPKDNFAGKRGKDDPTSPQWPNLPGHNKRMYGGKDAAEIAGPETKNYVSDYKTKKNHELPKLGPEATDIDNEHPFAQHDLNRALVTATTENNLNLILYELCGECCAKVTFIVEIERFIGSAHASKLVPKTFKDTVKRPWGRFLFKRTIPCDEPARKR